MGSVEEPKYFCSTKKSAGESSSCLPNCCQNRSSYTVSRRVYHVPSSNALWHIDGLHCLVRWRIVVHGCIDGYSRKVIYLHASDNNRDNYTLPVRS